MNKYSFYEIISNYQIQIPIIQRDYVQGRDEHSQKRKIHDFINVLSESLIRCSDNQKNKPLSLNFIYGYEGNGNCFIPIDGQQRLTTLYLLHLYVFVKADKKDETDRLKNALQYFVRPSSNRFFDALLENTEWLKEGAFEEEKPLCQRKINQPKKYEDDENDINEFLNECKLTKANWFRKCWLNDLTVRSSIVSLYLIKEELKGQNFEALSERLTDKNNPAIYFSYLTIADTDKASETYVKMNARGKQLTGFENFKAELYSYFDNRFSAPHFEEFKKKIDSEWLSGVLKLIMGKYDISGAKEELLQLDSQLFSLFNMIQTNNMAIIKENPLDFVKKSVFTMPTEDITLKEYLAGEEDLENKEDTDQQLIKLKFDRTLRETIEEFLLLMDFLHQYMKDDDRVQIVLSALRNAIGNSNSNEHNNEHYNERLILFSMIKFLKEVPDSCTDREDYFTQWVNMFRHILDHSEIDNRNDFIKALKNLKEKLSFNLSGGTLYGSAASILRNLQPPFNQAQINDEIQKAEKRNNSQQWEDVIRKYEDVPYFSGQSIFLSDWCGTKDHTDYEKYWEKTIEIFTDYSKKNNPVLALFSMNNVLVKVKEPLNQNKNSVSFGFNDSKHHKYDWRGILEDKTYVTEYLKVLDDFISTGKGFKSYLKSKLSSIPTTMPDYQRDPEQFLKYVLSHNYKTEDVFKKGGYQFTTSGCEKCYLLKGSGTNRDDTLDLSIAYIMFRYLEKGYKPVPPINYSENKITMTNGTSEFTIQIDGTNGHYQLNSVDYPDLCSVLGAMP